MAARAWMCLWAMQACALQAAVLAPPWADVRRNPCASHPRGWLMLYWPPDGKCYNIYKKGHPCPETMELSPGHSGSKTVAECMCPPGSAQLDHSTPCYKLFERGPCQGGEYFAPVEESFNKRGERKGMCVKPLPCEDETKVFWPADGRCYSKLSQGPCYAGSLLYVDLFGLANCTCAAGGHQWSADGGCYEHYTRGPCGRGQLFLPDARCGCDPHLPHYHNETAGCYQIDTVGPCDRGQTFSIREMPTGDGEPARAACACKPFHVPWRAGAGAGAAGACYRRYTRGPCGAGEMVAGGGRCARVPCSRGRLYFPERRRCYRPGDSNPCPDGGVVTFDFEARPSVDGVSYNGKCACARCGRGGPPAPAPPSCRDRLAMVALQGTCYMLYTRGPCGEGAWLVPGGEGRAGGAVCQCRPDRAPPSCDPPVVRLAEYLNAKSLSLMTVR